MASYNYTVQLNDVEKTILNFQKINERYIILSPCDPDIEIKNEKNEIITLDYKCDYKITVNSTLILKEKNKYKITKISKQQHDNKTYYYLYMHPLINKSTTFIMPFLGYNKETFRFNNEFIKCYIGTEEFGDYGNNIYLLYRYSADINFVKFEENILIQNPLYEETYEVDKYQTLYKFKIEEKYKNDIDKIIKGKYSEISEDAKNKILKFNNAITNGDLEQILYKRKERRLKLEEELKINIDENAELYSIFNIEDEILLNKYIII